jgi:hypothetical protein
MRYTFGTSGRAVRGRVLVLVGLPLFAITAALLFGSGRRWWGLAAALVALVCLVGVLGIRRWFTEIALVLDPSGFQVDVGRQRFELPWDQVQAWTFADLFRGRPTLSDFPALLVFPVDGVDPDNAGGRFLWQRQAGCWRIGKARRFVGPVTLLEALEVVAPGRRRNASRTLIGTTPKEIKPRLPRRR